MQTLMPEDGPFRHLIADTYAKDTLKQIKQLTSSCHSHRIVPVANGLVAASGNQGADSVSGCPNVWASDNVMVANSFRLRGELHPAISCVQGLTRFFRTQLPRFREVISDPVATLREGSNCRPHIRFTAETLAELPEKWPHAQNDSRPRAVVSLRARKYRRFAADIG